MPDTGSRHPLHATVEDWDDDAQTTLSSTRATATANVAVKRSQTALDPERPKTKAHDGSDSGYSSKAPTVGSASTGAGKMANLKIDTSLQERERHPYLVSAGGNAPRRESFTRPKTAPSAPPAVDEPPFVHPKGVCMTCDYYGKHTDLPVSAVQPPTPASPKVAKKSSATTKQVRVDSDPRLKRGSSNPSAPPASYSQSPAVQPIYSASPYAQTSGCNSPATPMVYTYATPITSTYVGPIAQNSYFDPPPTSEARPPNPHRRSSQYGDPVIQQNLRDEKRAAEARVGSRKETRSVQPEPRSTDRGPKPSARDGERPYTTSADRSYDSRPTRPADRDYDIRPQVAERRDSDRVPAATIERSADRRPPIATHRSTRSIAKDRVAMPPPERPSRQPEVTRRPSLKKSSTYNPEVVDYRRSRTADDYETVEVKVPPSPKAREVPPSSYRGPQDEATSRPRPSRKSVSYSDPVTTSKVYQTKSNSKNDSHQRRTTNPISSMEQKAAKAEAYQRSRSNLTSEELTTERLNDLKKQRSNTLSSETGSAYSHRESHHSSSRGSSGRVRSHTSGQRTSILIDKGIKLEIPADYERKGRPVSIDLGGGMMLSLGSKEKETKRESKMIENTPSAGSHASKHSSTSATYEIPSRGREHNESSKSSRRPSHNEDRRPPVTDRSQKSSRQHSRAPSMSRGSRRQSSDYSGGYSGW